jgi:hypothetical protein
LSSTHSALRVNRTFYEIVNRIFYKDISLLTYTRDIVKFEEILSWLFVPHVRHLQSLHMWGGSSSSKDSKAWEDYYEKFLQECANLKNLNLWFHTSHFERQWIKLRNALLFLMINGKLTSLGFYCYNVAFGSEGSYCEYNVHLILHAIAESETARSRLKTLDLALSGVSLETETLIRSKFPKLESLTIRRTFSARPARLQGNRWGRLEFLTRLQIHKCCGINASDIPDLVALFPALRELLVSYFQVYESVKFHERYPKNWHLLQNALCNSRRPLEWIHVDNLVSGEIKFIGLIPTKMLIITATNPRIILAELDECMYLFPGMKVLRRQDTVTWKMYGSYGIANDTVLNEWCATRNIEVEVISRPSRPFYHKKMVNSYQTIPRL